MQTKSIKFLIIPILLFSFAVFASAEGDRDPLSSSYIFYLYYDNGQLVTDRDYEFKYDVIPEKFVAESLAQAQGALIYKGEVINIKNAVSAVFEFDPQGGDLKFKKGKLSVKAPYFADAKAVNFYDDQGTQLLSVSVAESSFCNDDNVCNADVGEDQNTCPNDCKPVSSPSVSNQPGSGDTGSMTKILIYSLIVLVAGVGLWFGWKWWQSRQQGGGGGADTMAPPDQQAYIPIK